MQISEELRFDAAPARVWPLLTTGDGLRLWVDGVERLEPDPLAVGLCRVVVRAAGVTHEQAIDVLGCEAPSRLMLSLSGGNLPVGASLVVEIVLEAEEAGTRARIEAEARVSGFLAGLALPAMIPVAKGRLREAGARLQAALAGA